MDFVYENGIVDYVNEIADGTAMTETKYIECERRGRDREDKPDYNVKLSVAFCFSNKVNMLEYYHNSSFLEHGGSPDKAVSNAFVYTIDNISRQTISTPKMNQR